jgi:hypothetical protein
MSTRVLFDSLRSSTTIASPYWSWSSVVPITLTSLFGFVTEMPCSEASSLAFWAWISLALSWVDRQAVRVSAARTASARPVVRHRLNRTLR